MADDVSLSEQFADLERRFSDFDNYLSSYFMKLDPRARGMELSIFDCCLHDEAYNGKNSRDFAEHWNRRREMQRSTM